MLLAVRLIQLSTMISLQAMTSLSTFYCKFGNFREIVFSRIFDFQMISKFLSSRGSTRAIYRAYSNSLLAKTLFRKAANSRILAKMKFSRTFPNLQ